MNSNFGIFDFNREGKADFSEQFLGFMIIQDMINTEENDSDFDGIDGSDQE